MKSNFNSEGFRYLMKGLLSSINMLDKEMETKFCISSTRAQTLSTLKDKKSLKMSELSEQMFLTSSTMTRIVDNLIKDELVERGGDTCDRRVVVVKLTNKGKKLTKDIEEFKDKYFEAVKEKVEGNGTKEMFSSLKTLIDAFEDFKSTL
ncbi:MAG: MarR family transcriptional regulator [Candidatus Scalindua sp.]|nr:MarR family transcriptional regulator [Candidatus Scalindua sp.]